MLANNRKVSNVSPKHCQYATAFVCATAIFSKKELDYRVSRHNQFDAPGTRM